MCAWIERSKTKQSAAARFRMALRRSCVETDADLRALWESRIWAVANRPYAKVRKRKARGASA